LILIAVLGERDRTYASGFNLLMQRRSDQG
jgi:hypothetical protein